MKYVFLLEKNVIEGSTNQSLYEMTQDKLGRGFT